jgi:hypothetical protein
MFIIGEVAVDDSVGDASFCCDLKKCKGACCCIDGGRGAPLEDDEVLEIEKAYPAIKHYLSENSIRTIEQSGLYEGSAGNFATTCIEQRDCVFVYRDGDIARCSFERAFEQGTIDWRKPISCHLFPIRIQKLEQDFLHYEQIDECSAGRTSGELHKTKLYDFLKEPLVRKYGDAWYKTFLSHCETKMAKH